MDQQRAAEGEIPEDAMKEDKENELRHVMEDGYCTQVLLDELSEFSFQLQLRHTLSHPAQLLLQFIGFF